LPHLEGFGKEMTKGTIENKEQVKRENQRLREYGWIDRDAGVVHVPIDVAMRKTAGRLKSRDGTDEDEFLQAPSSSSSGRMPRGGSK
jgi:hypothetical protein